MAAETLHPFAVVIVRMPLSGLEVVGRADIEDYTATVVAQNAGLAAQLALEQVSVWENLSWHCNLWHCCGLTVRISRQFEKISVREHRPLEASFMFNPNRRHGSFDYQYVVDERLVELDFNKSGDTWRLVNGAELVHKVAEVAEKLRVAVEENARFLQTSATNLGSITRKQ